ncbi:MAG TPA: polysaccharide deacetylase family protein [Thermoanaerobaculia bacterium]
MGPTAPTDSRAQRPVRPIRPIGRPIVALLLAAGLLLFGAFHLSRSRTFQLFGTIVQRVDTERRVVALTFDDGPTREYTDSVLATLRQHNVRGSFYLVGRDVQRNPDLVRRILAEGHEVGNHSWSHERMLLKSPSWIRGEVENTDRVLRAAGVTGPIHFRAPYCKKLVGLPWYLARTNRTHVTFDVEPETEERVAASAQLIADDVLQKVQPGSIILLHVMFRSREESRKALPLIIPRLRAAGYDFVTVSELLAMR